MRAWMTALVAVSLLAAWVAPAGAATGMQGAGSTPAAQDPKPASQETKPPTQGAKPPTQGAKPPTQGAKPPTQGAKPPQGTKPQPVKPPGPPPKPGSREPGRPGSFEASAQLLYVAAASLGTGAATLTPNQAGSGSRFTLFTAAGELAGSPGFAATVGYNVTRTYTAEGAFGYSARPLRVSVSGDAENASGFSFDGENLAQYVVEGTLVVHLRRLSFARGRGRTFVSGGAGYRREVHDGNFTIDTGQVYHAGGGVKYYFKPRARGFIRAFGIRAEGRLLLGVGGYTFDGRNTQTFAARGGAVIAF